MLLRYYLWCVSLLDFVLGADDASINRCTVTEYTAKTYHRTHTGIHRIPTTTIDNYVSTITALHKSVYLTEEYGVLVDHEKGSATNSATITYNVPSTTTVTVCASTSLPPGFPDTSYCSYKATTTTTSTVYATVWNISLTTHYAHTVNGTGTRTVGWVTAWPPLVPKRDTVYETLWDITTITYTKTQFMKTKTTTVSTTFATPSQFLLQASWNGHFGHEELMWYAPDGYHEFLDNACLVFSDEQPAEVFALANGTTLYKPLTNDTCYGYVPHPGDDNGVIDPSTIISCYGEPPDDYYQLLQCSIDCVGRLNCYAGNYSGWTVYEFPVIYSFFQINFCGTLQIQDGPAHDLEGRTDMYVVPYPQIYL